MKNGAQIKTKLDTDIECVQRIISEFEDENLDNSHPMDLLKARLLRLEKLREELYP